jgi:hypothetical protein
MAELNAFTAVVQNAQLHRNLYAKWMMYASFVSDMLYCNNSINHPLHKSVCCGGIILGGTYVTERQY